MRAEIKPNRRNAWLFSVVRVLLLLVTLYVGSYFILMSRSTPAVWDSGKAEGWIASPSSFRWASQWHGRPTHTDWNDLFEPMDKIYFSAFPNRARIEEKAEP